jgi:hypothetical protein
MLYLAQINLQLTARGATHMPMSRRALLLARLHGKDLSRIHYT